MYSATGRSPSSGRGGGVGRLAAVSGAVSGAALFAAWAVGADAVQAQNADRLTGIVAGMAESEQVWSPAVDTDRRAGFLVGAFVDVRTPVTGLRVRAEGSAVRRGGLVLSDYRGGALDGEVQSDYLSFQLHAKVGGSVGPVHVFAAAGPGVDYLVRSREDAVLAQVLIEEHATVMTGSAGVGAGIRIGAFAAEAEGRWVRGLTDAYRGSSVTVRNRSLEWVLRVARTR